VEQLLADVWCEVLGLDRVGVHDNFFDLGGDSILAIRIVSRVRRVGLSLKPRHVFECQTIDELALVVGASGSAAEAEPEAVGAVPLTPVQAWFFDQMLDNSSHFNQAFRFTVSPDTDLPLLERVFNRVIQEHAVFAATFVEEDGEWMQIFQHKPAGVFFEVLDPNDEVEALHSLQRSLNIETGKTIAIGLLSTDGLIELVVVIHHLVIDVVSWRVLLEDVADAYSAFSSGTGWTATRTASYKRWAEHLREEGNSATTESELAYWLAQQAETRFGSLDDDRNLVAEAGNIVVELDEEATARIRNALSLHSTQMVDVVLATSLMSLRNTFGGDTWTITFEGHGREDVGTELDLTHTIGWFTSLFPLKVTLPDRQDLRSVVAAVADQRHQVPRRGLGYGLLRYLGPHSVRASLAEFPPPEISFNYLGTAEPAPSAANSFAPLSHADGPVGPIHASTGRRAHVIDVISAIHSGRLTISWIFPAALLDPSQMRGVATAHLALLDSLDAQTMLGTVIGKRDSVGRPSDIDPHTLKIVLQRFKR
jgi:non-ribosomal peptide synthase protein (TIGR01720 family)